MKECGYCGKETQDETAELCDRCWDLRNMLSAVDSDVAGLVVLQQLLCGNVKLPSTTVSEHVIASTKEFSYRLESWARAIRDGNCSVDSFVNTVFPALLKSFVASESPQKPG
jgi:hypothetical protein